MNKLNKFLVLYNSIKLFLTILVLGNIFKVSAQKNPNFDRGRQYILARVDVIGKISYNEQTIVTFAGLQKGERIIVPGEEISNAIKKLWKLGLFNDINFYVNKIEGDSIYLDLNITELPKLKEVKIQGVKKGKKESLIKDNGLTKGKIVNENLITTTKNYIENKYRKEGFYNAKVAINTILDSLSGNDVNMVINIDRGDKVKVSEIFFEGNEMLSDKKLKKAMKNTKEKSMSPLRIFKSSKYIKDKYQEDLTNIVNKYKEKGYRDARVIYDSIGYNREKNTVTIKVNVEEGNKYYFGKFKFLGNTVYTDQQLTRVLGLKKGDVYNGILLQKRIDDQTNPDGENITNLYQNNGYLFSNINAVEVRTANDTIDFEIRIVEGPMAYFNRITVSGNEKTNDPVIYRELRTKPGQKWSKEQVIRTIREIGALGFFDPENIKPDIKPNPSDGTVDIEYHLVEKGASQIELQGGYGGGGFIGTLGLSFNNFSVRNIFNKEAYRPLPMGDGQKLALRLQASNAFRTYSLSFSEPWFGGKKPVQFSTSISQSTQYLTDNSGRNVDKNKSFNITSLSVGWAKRLSVPDDYFVFSQAIGFQYYNLNNYNTRLFTFGDGSSKNLAYTIGLTRNNKGLNPIFPTYGSEFSVTAKLTFPYSLFNGVDYANLENTVEFQNADGTPNQSKIDQQKFNWLEYYKIKFRADLYTTVYGNLVFRTLGEFGFLGAYNSAKGLIPFERFFVGGDGLANFALDSREVIQLRGYPNNSLSSQDGGTVYNKFSLELRYPITLKSAASIYALTFLEAGNSFDTFREFEPFTLKRSAGFGLRVFMPAFGLLGIDFGYGFDAIPGTTQRNGWETHFIIGQQF